MKPAQGMRVHEWCDAQTTANRIDRARRIVAAVYATDAPREAKPVHFLPRHRQSIRDRFDQVTPGQRSHIAILAQACTIDDQEIADAAQGKQWVMPKTAPVVHALATVAECERFPSTASAATTKATPPIGIEAWETGQW